MSEGRGSPRRRKWLWWGFIGLVAIDICLGLATLITVLQAMDGLSHDGIGSVAHD